MAEYLEASASVLMIPKTAPNAERNALMIASVKLLSRRAGPRETTLVGQTVRRKLHLPRSSIPGSQLCACSELAARPIHTSFRARSGALAMAPIPRRPSPIDCRNCGPLLRGDPKHGAGQASFRQLPSPSAQAD